MLYLHHTMTRLFPGLVVAAVVSLAAVAVEHGERAALGQPVIEALVAAILIGMLIRNTTPLPKQVDPGAAFSAKQILEAAVLLLGATIDVRQVLSAGPLLLIVIAAGVVAVSR